MNTHTTRHTEPARLQHGGNRLRSQTANRTSVPRWTRIVLLVDGVFLLVAGFAALVADLAGYSFGGGPFAALASEPLAIGAVEAHGLAALVGLLVICATPSERWRWHTIALVVHLFLGVCNLLFWQVYTVMGATTVGLVSTCAHALFFGAQLACLAQPSSDEFAALPAWLCNARQSGLYVRSVAISTLLLGAGTHIAVILLGRDVQPRILTPAFELLLTVPMFYVSIAGWLAWRSFRFRGRWHQAALGFILMYFPIGLPFHVITITTGSTAHYAAFPEQYSLLIVPVMAVMIACFASLRVRKHTSPPQ